jgi:hypothetical protein
MNVCGYLAWKTLSAHSAETVRVPGVGVWGSTALSGQKCGARESEISPCVEEWLCEPMGWDLVCRAGYSLSLWWYGEAFYELGTQSVDVSALLGALPQSSVSPASYQCPWITEVRRSVAAFQLPSWISPSRNCI